MRAFSKIARIRLDVQGWDCDFGWEIEIGITRASVSLFWDQIEAGARRSINPCAVEST